ncbi:glycoside hydrolase family 113 [Streptomyces sp. NPDC007905]|uniref:glycoside hydrolase family 113 n=1 Tax=Streptomyces sp. NPDC007905 TaxID=3364788 RepID=UPI0036E4559E
MRSRLPLLAIFPVTVLTLVLGTPFVLGNHPVRWESGSALPKIVTGDDKDSSASSGHSGGTASAPSGSPSSATDALRVAKPWKKGMAQWGVQLYWEEEKKKRSDTFIENQARKHAKYLIGLGANSVSVSFPFFIQNSTSNALTVGAKTPSPERLQRVLNVFRDAGFRTTVRPILDEGTLKQGNGWRGNIDPAFRSAWFASYKKFLTPYLQASEDAKANTFVIGTELNSLEGDPGWETLVSHAEQSFSGQVSYDANWDNYVSGRISMPVNHLGIDAYFPVKVPDTAPVSELVAGWNKWLDRKATGPLPKILISETGIGAMNGAYHAPGDFYARRAVNPRVQANWYKAVCQVVEERHMQGVYWWSIHFEDDPNTPPDDKTASRLDFAGRPLSEKAIKTCFASDYAGPGTGTTS